jgi:hypothetical protein
MGGKKIIQEGQKQKALAIKIIKEILANTFHSHSQQASVIAYSCSTQTFIR